MASRLVACRGAATLTCVVPACIRAAIAGAPPRHVTSGMPAGSFQAATTSSWSGQRCCPCLSCRSSSCCRWLPPCSNSSTDDAERARPPPQSPWSWWSGVSAATAELRVQVWPATDATVAATATALLRDPSAASPAGQYVQRRESQHVLSHVRWTSNFSRSHMLKVIYFILQTQSNSVLYTLQKPTDMHCFYFVSICGTLIWKEKNKNFPKFSDGCPAGSLQNQRGHQPML